MTIDSQNYLALAEAMVKSGAYLFTTDSDHSSLMQIILAALFRITHGQPLLVCAVFKTLLYGFWVLVLVLSYRASRLVGLSRRWSEVVVVLISFSEILQRYCSIIQYEVLGAFLFMVLINLQLSGFRRCAKWNASLKGAWLFVLGVLRVHYLIALIPEVVLRWSNLKDRKNQRLTLAVVMVGVLSWSVFYSVEMGEPILMQKMRKLRLSLNHDANPYNFPFNNHFTGNSGLSFIVENPGEYFELLARRAPYSVGAKSDDWFVESRWTTMAEALVPMIAEAIRPVIAWTSVVLFLFGCVWGVSANRESWIITGPIVSVLAGQLLVGASTRFWVPVIPCVVIFQVFGLAKLVSVFKNRLVLSALSRMAVKSSAD